MKSYGQYCPIARASEIFAERWTPVIIRNILLGCHTFTQIAKGAPGISKTLLAQRLKELERFGIIEMRPNTSGRGSQYLPTPAGVELWDVCDALGRWGARWLDVAPEHLDPYVILWSMCNSLAADRLPDRRIVVRFDFSDLERKNRFWLILEGGDGEICLRHPGFEEDLFVRADSEWFAQWHMGRITWSDAVRARRITVQGPRELARAFPKWNRLSRFADIKPMPTPAKQRTKKP